jgi:transposase
MAKRQPYFTDLSDDERLIVEPLVPPVKRGGRPVNHLRREVVNAILYVLRTGCQWEALPHDLPSLENGLYVFSQLAFGRDPASDP